MSSSHQMCPKGAGWYSGDSKCTGLSLQPQAVLVIICVSLLIPSFQSAPCSMVRMRETNVMINQLGAILGFYH